MELNHLAVDEPPHPSASIVLLRDGAAGLEVFLLRRHGDSAAFGGAYVFAGGKVDTADKGAQAMDRLDQNPGDLADQLGEPALSTADASGLYVAAVRELFEETAVLLAKGPGGTPTRPLQDMLKGGMGFHAAMEQLNLRLQTTLLVPWSRWITPKVPSVSRKRFDTRFFLCRVPSGQAAVHDNHETVDSVWLTPRAALEAYWDRRFEFAPPQIMGLVQLARHTDVQSALQAARTNRPPCIAPHGFLEGGERAVCYPGDPLHPEPGPVMCGPTRLYFRSGRFEPRSGLQDLLP